jgi:hypothetical protein
MSVVFTNVLVLLRHSRVLNSGWLMQLMCDGTFNFAYRNIASLGMDVMAPGGMLRPLSFIFVPTKSAERYDSSFERSAISFVTKFWPCDDPACTTRQSVVVVIKNEVTVEPGKSPVFQRNTPLAVYIET